MHDIYVVDLDHPQDAQGRTRMRLAADSVADRAQADQIGRAACLDMLEAAGALDTARGHVVNAPAYPNPETVVKFALGLGDPFTAMNRYWIQSQSDGTLSEHVPTPAELAEELQGRSGVDVGSALAAALEALAAVARSRSASPAAVETVLQFFVALRADDWASTPKPFTVHGGAGISWKHTVRRGGDGALRMGGRFSVVITASRVVFLRTTNISTAVASAETVYGEDTSALIAEYFRTGRLPGEQEATEEAPQASPDPDSAPAPEPAPEPVVEEALSEPELQPELAPDPTPEPAQAQQHPQVRLVARWNMDNGQLFVTTLEGAPIDHTPMAAAETTAKAAAALDAAGFDRNGGWTSVSVAPRELRVAVTTRTAAA